jgi:hypothetical protein
MEADILQLAPLDTDSALIGRTPERVNYGRLGRPERWAHYPGLWAACPPLPRSAISAVAR